MVDRNARLLDIGCANGGLLTELRTLGFDRLTGVDPSPARLGTFDCIVLSHVLEHIFDLQAAVGALGGILAPDGILYAEVPDAARYHDFLVAPFQDFNTEHINHFSTGCLTNLLRRFGYRRIAGGHKEIASSSDSLTPAVFGFYRRARSAWVLEPDRILKERILAYIADSAELLGQIDAQLDRSLEGCPSVIVWGTGQLTMKLLCESRLANHDVAAFVDNSAVNQGKILRGVGILSPRQLKESGRAQPIVIGSLLHGREIVDGIRANLGLGNKLILLRPAPAH